MIIAHCQTSHLKEPLGFQLGQLVFSWTAEQAAGKRQTEAAIRVWEEDRLILDTGFSSGISSLGFTPEISLRPRTRYAWQATVRSDAGEEAVSTRNPFETGKMGEPWQARWISAEKAKRLPVFCRRIQPNGEVVRARLYICGLGLYEARIDGQKGILVDETTPGTPAAKGLKAGDFIIAANGKPVGKLHELTRMLYATGVGNEVKLTVLRGEQELTIPVRLYDRLTE